MCRATQADSSVGGSGGRQTAVEGRVFVGVEEGDDAVEAVVGPDLVKVKVVWEERMTWVGFYAWVGFMGREDRQTKSLDRQPACSTNRQIDKGRRLSYKNIPLRSGPRRSKGKCPGVPSMNGPRGGRSKRCHRVIFHRECPS